MWAIFAVYSEHMSIFDPDLDKAVRRAIDGQTDGLVLGYTLVVNYLDSQTGEEEIKMAAPADQRVSMTCLLTDLSSQISGELLSRKISLMMEDE